MKTRTRRRTFGELLIDALGSGWMDRERDREWVVYEQRTNDICHVTPPTLRNARREAKLSADYGLLVIPYVAARQLANAYNHGRASERRKAAEQPVVPGVVSDMQAAGIEASGLWGDDEPDEDFWDDRTTPLAYSRSDSMRDMGHQ